MGDMAKRIERLTPRAVKSAKVGYHRWRRPIPSVLGHLRQIVGYRYKIHDRVRDMGLGSYPDMSLAEAREEAKKWRQLCTRGEDPR